MRFFADTDDYRNQACCGTGIRQERRHGCRNNHNAYHELCLTGTEKLYNISADILGQSCIEHSCTDDEHTAKKDNRRIGEPHKHFNNWDQAENPARNGSQHGCNCQRDFFCYEQNRYDKKQQQTGDCRIHST